MAFVNTCEWYDPSCGINYVGDEIGLLILDAYSGVLDSVVSVLGAIPMPAFLSNIGTFNSPASVSWGADMMNIEYGIGIFIAAYTFRFILRRIPVIG
jgi:hypothetical protein